MPPSALHSPPIPPTSLDTPRNRRSCLYPRKPLFFHLSTLRILLQVGSHLLLLPPLSPQKTKKMTRTCEALRENGDVRIRLCSTVNNERLATLAVIIQLPTSRPVSFRSVPVTSRSRPGPVPVPSRSRSRPGPVPVLSGFRPGFFPGCVLAMFPSCSIPVPFVPVSFQLHPVSSVPSQFRPGSVPVPSWLRPGYDPVTSRIFPGFAVVPFILGRSLHRLA